MDDIVLRQIEYVDLARFMVAVAIASQQAEIIWSQDSDFKVSIMDSFIQAGDLGKDAFFSSLAPHLANGSLENISPILLTPYVNHLYDKERLQLTLSLICEFLGPLPSAFSGKKSRIIAGEVTVGT